MQWNVLRLPGFHEGPVQGTQKEMLSPASYKSVFDFSEIIEVVQNAVVGLWSLVFDLWSSFTVPRAQRPDAIRNLPPRVS